MATSSTGAGHVRARRIRRSIAALLVLCTTLALLPTPTLAITRDVVISRGMRWVNLNIPYSQTAWRTAEGAVATSRTGYRTDCSGFVSMAWKLENADGSPLSLTTSTLPVRSSQIATSSMQPGDAFIAPYNHAILFGGWADAKKASFYALEERNTQYGTVRSVRYVSKLSKDYRPYKYKGIEEDYLAYIEPLRGTEPIGTSLAVSRSAFATGTVTTVVLAPNDSWRDQLAAQSLAGAAEGPLLLVNRNRLRSDVRNEIKRLGAKKLYLVGASIEPTVQTQLAKYAKVKRVAGPSAADTAVKSAWYTREELKAHGRTFDGIVYLASSELPAASLAIGPIAAAKGRPVLFTAQKAMPKATASALGWLRAKRVYVLGDWHYALQAVVKRADALVPGIATRLSGAGPYATAMAIVKHETGSGLKWSRAGVVGVKTPSDAFVAGPALAGTPSVLLVTPAEDLYSGAFDAIKANRAEIGKVRCIGLMNSVSAAARRDIAVALGM